MDERTHVATQKWTVGPYTFLEAMPKIGTSSDAPIYFAMFRDELVSRSSYVTLEEAMRAAAVYGAVAHVEESI